MAYAQPCVLLSPKRPTSYETVHQRPMIMAQAQHDVYGGVMRGRVPLVQGPGVTNIPVCPGGQPGTALLISRTQPSFDIFDEVYDVCYMPYRDNIVASIVSTVCESMLDTQTGQGHQSQRGLWVLAGRDLLNNLAKGLIKDDGQPQQEGRRLCPCRALHNGRFAEPVTG